MTDELERLREQRNPERYESGQSLTAYIERERARLEKMANDPTAAAREAEAKRRQEAAAQQALADQQRERLMKWRSSGFPERSIQVITAAKHRLTWPQPDVPATAWKALRQGQCVVLLGDAGPGKTTMATELALRLILHTGRTAQYFKAADLVADFRHQCYSAGRKEGDWMGAMARVHLLVIDEWDKRSATDQTADMVLLRLLDKRYDAMAPTMLISNLKPDQWDEGLHRSLRDRLRQWGQLLICAWPSFRGAKS